eukprot:519738_1
MNALLNQINIMNTAIPFKHPFITEGSDVLDYITAIDQNVIVNPLLTAAQQYQLIIRQIPTEYIAMFNKYIVKQQAEQHAVNSIHYDANIRTYHTLAYLKRWLLDTWPPAVDRWQLLGEVYRMRYHRNEDPTSVYTRVVTAMDRVDAI